MGSVISSPDESTSVLTQIQEAPSAICSPSASSNSTASTVSQAGDGAYLKPSISFHLREHIADPLFPHHRLFIVEGVITCGVAIIFACFMPNTINKIWNLNQQQADFVRWNFEKDQKQLDHSDEIGAWQGFLMAVKDPKTWMLCGTLYSTYTAAAVNNFFPTVVGGLGFSRNASYGMTAPPFILAGFCMLVVGFHSDRVRLVHRCSRKQMSPG